MSTDIAARAATLVALEAEKARVIAKGAAAHRAARRQMLNDLPGGVIYPQTYGGFPACASCFQRTSDLNTCADPRDSELVILCRPCHRALCAGRPPVLPTGELLADTWERLARLHQNGEIHDATIDAALAKLAPQLTHVPGWAALQQLREALLRLQHIRGDDFDPADGDRDYLEGEADRDRKNALAKLMVGDTS